MIPYIIYTITAFALISLAIFNVIYWKKSINVFRRRITDTRRILVPKKHKANSHHQYHPDVINVVEKRQLKQCYVAPDPHASFQRAYIKDQYFFAEYILKPITTINIFSFIGFNLLLLFTLWMDLPSWYTTAINLSMASIIGSSSMYGLSKHKKYFGDFLSDDYVPYKDRYEYVQYLVEEFNHK